MSWSSTTHQDYRRPHRGGDRSAADDPPGDRRPRVEFWTSDNIMRIDQLPASMVIVGGGSVATEFAAHILRPWRRDSHRQPGRRAARDARYRRLRALYRARPAALGRPPGGKITAVHGRYGGGATVVLDDGTKVAGDLLLVAAGRQPNTDDLGLELAGVKVRDDGRVQVDEYGRTTADGIWSIGDASSPFELKHVANSEARTVAHNLAHPDDLRPFQHDWVPAAVFTNPEIATVGARGRIWPACGPTCRPPGRITTPPTDGPCRTPADSAGCTRIPPPAGCSAPTSSAIRPRC